MLLCCAATGPVPCADRLIARSVMECANNTEPKHMIFMYGTLKKGQPNHTYLTDVQLGRADFVTSARTVECWPLVIASKFNIPFLIKKEGMGKRIYGELYRVDDKMLEFLDDFEGHPTLYIRSPVQVESLNDHGTSEVLECLTYMLVNYEPDLLKEEMLENYDSKNRPYDKENDDLKEASKIYDS